ncbi:MAG: TIGR03619 family F420-dependent LLM class oxidoreductase [Chloroflexi bacterium]|nr:TIGR03619 family F420-dependent LLM class oxidoreductase [Chloroflexota bacterium]
MSIRIGIGIAGFPFSGPGAFFDWVDLCEERGADSLWFSERLVSSALALEPMTAIAAVAGRTSRVKFGMNAVVLPFRDPLVLAKECATIDYLSAGRLLPVFGVGSENAPEFRATGQDPRGRGARSDEILEVMARLWEGGPVSYQGEHYRYDGAVISPLPVQKPLPVWIGGSSPAAIRRTARLGTGWLAGLQTPAQVQPVVAAIRAAAAEAGRTIDADHYGAGFSFRFGNRDEPAVERAARGFGRIAPGVEMADYAAVGGKDDILRRIREYVDAGVSKFVARPIADTDAEMMEQTARLLDEVAPALEALQG